jgi:hypothetical protein
VKELFFNKDFTEALNYASEIGVESQTNFKNGELLVISALLARIVKNKKCLVLLRTCWVLK